MKRQINIPRIAVGAPQGRSGKTTFTIGLLAGLAKKNYTVQSFKKGPDFIDPSWHTTITGRLCRNLDRFMMSTGAITGSFARAVKGADIAVIEGAMGLFDGVDLEGSNSTAEIARITGSPVILVVNATRMTRSVAAIVKGCMEFDPEITIAGVVLNRVARSRHENMLRSAVEHYCGVPVLGAIPGGKQFDVPDRHLGLVPAAENEELEERIDAVGREAERYMDIDGIVEAAEKAAPVSSGCAVAEETEIFTSLRDCFCAREQGDEARIGVCLDRAFSFYYPENLEALRTAGAALVPVDTMNDSKLPEVDALYIGGGFPEVFSGELENNSPMRDEIYSAAEDGMPVYAECGGLMYLGKGISWEGKRSEMTGVLPLEVEMLKKPQGHGYVALEAARENPYFELGAAFRGHEFHHSRVINAGCSLKMAWKITRGHGVDGQSDGFVYKNVLASYTHLHALGVPEWAPALVKKAREYRGNKRSAQ